MIILNSPRSTFRFCGPVEQRGFKSTDAVQPPVTPRRDETENAPSPLRPKDLDPAVPTTHPRWKHRPGVDRRPAGLGREGGSAKVRYPFSTGLLDHARHELMVNDRA